MFQPVGSHKRGRLQTADYRIKVFNFQLLRIVFLVMVSTVRRMLVFLIVMFIADGDSGIGWFSRKDCHNWQKKSWIGMQSYMALLKCK